MLWIFSFLFSYKRLAPFSQYLANIFGILSTSNVFMVILSYRSFLFVVKDDKHLAIFSFTTSVSGKVCRHDWSIIKILLCGSPSRDATGVTQGIRKRNKTKTRERKSQQYLASKWVWREKKLRDDPTVLSLGITRTPMS